MKDYQKGQVLLIIVLVMVVAMTIGLSVATRTITSLRTSAEEENSNRAFSAAEAGIEYALSNQSGISGSFDNDASYQTIIGSSSGVNILLQNGIPILKDEAIDVWLSDYPDYTNPYSGNFTIFWGDTSDVCDTAEATNSMPALDITLITGTKASPRVARYALDPCQSRSQVNNFEYVPRTFGNVAGQAFEFKRTFVINSGLLVRIVPLYAGGKIGVKGCDSTNSNCTSLPSQGTYVESIGISDNVQRKIVSLRSHPRLPVALFPYVLFSPK